MLRRLALVMLICCSATTAWSDWNGGFSPPTMNDAGVVDIPFELEGQINGLGVNIETHTKLGPDGCEYDCQVDVTTGEFFSCTATANCTSDWSFDLNDADVKFELEAKLDFGNDCSLSGSCCYDANGNLTGDVKLCIGEFNLNTNYDNGDITLGGGLECDGWSCTIKVDPNGGDIFIGGQINF